MKYYCIGIKGAGMSTLAQILYDLGNEVSGYDDYSGYKYTQDGLDSRGIKIYYDNYQFIINNKWNFNKFHSKMGSLHLCHFYYIKRLLK